MTSDTDVGVNQEEGKGRKGAQGSWRREKKSDMTANGKVAWQIRKEEEQVRD